MSLETEELLQTTCTECDSVFQLNKAQLLAADGRVRCSECDEIFDAHVHLNSSHLNSSHLESTNKDTLLEPVLEQEIETLEQPQLDQVETTTVSLTDAMNDGQVINPTKSSQSLFWIIISAIQWIYFDRHQLIKKPKFQNTVLSLCKFLSCEDSKFKNTEQFSLIERNIFTHPTQANALLISGSFINEAPFAQQTPRLKVSLFNLQGEIIAQRHFEHFEYNQNPERLETIASGERIHFKLEVEDPNTVTITYEFEFI